MHTFIEYFYTRITFSKRSIDKEKENVPNLKSLTLLLIIISTTQSCLCYIIIYIPFLPQTRQWLLTTDCTELSYTEFSILFETNVQSGLLVKNKLQDILKDKGMVYNVCICFINT